MRIAKKFLAILLVVLSLTAGGVLSASAAEVDAPEFKLELVSETDTNVTVELSFVKGAISAFDITFVTSDAIEKCISIETTDAFWDFSLQHKKETGASIMADNTNPATMKAAFITTAPVEKATSIYKAEFAKKSAKNVTAADINVVFDSCAVTTTNGVGMTTNVDITDRVKVEVVFGSFAFRTKDYSVNYKTNFTLDFETNYATEDLVWETSNAKVLTVDEVGLVRTTGKGNATVTVKNANGDVLDTANVAVNYSVGQWLIIIFLFGWIWY